MIYTVTLNPAIDYVLRTDSLTPGKTNRASSEEIFFGGKGINVSYVLKELGLESVALGFTAGFTGAAIERGVAEMGIKADFIRLSEGNSRINVKIKSKEETELNASGPFVPQDKFALLMEKLDCLMPGDTLIMSGSIAKGLGADTYAKMTAAANNRKVRTVVDASGEAFRLALSERPFLVKPNLDELEEYFGVKTFGAEEVMEYALKMQKAGARNVLVSMAENGAVLVCEDGKVCRQDAFPGKVKNSVGAGDSMVAGFIAGLAGGDCSHALKLACAAGSATAFSDGLATKKIIENLIFGE